MKKNENFGVRRTFVPTMPDGLPQLFSIDNFPVSDPSNYKADGFPSSALGLLDRFSRDAVVNEEEIKAIASRLQSFEDDDKPSPFTEEQKAQMLRPAWCQTATELRDYQIRLGNIMDEIRMKNAQTTQTDEVKDIVDDGSVVSPQPISPVASE